MGNEASIVGREALEKYKSILPSNAESWLHWDYIVYLKKIMDEDEPWKDQKFLNLLNTQSKKVPVDENRKFCKWKDIQKEIFDAVMKKHNHVPYTWGDHAEGVLKYSNKTQKFNMLNCSKTDIPDEDTKTPINGCNFNTVELSTCLPFRRRNIHLDGIISNITDMERIMSLGNSAELKAHLMFGIMANSLGTKAKEEINILKKTGKKDVEICKIMQRNFADYKDLFDGKDIVSYKKSKDLQCKLKQINDKLQNELKNEQKYNVLWNSIFKNATDILLKDIKNGNGETCQLYNESQTENQCLRFLEEWFEEFLKKKKNIQNDLIRACLYNEKKVVKTKGGMAQMDCNFYCNAYENFLQSNKKCYDNYRKECIRNISKNKNMDENIAKADINVLLKKIKRKTNCDDSACGNEYEPHLNGLFDKNIDYLHKGYHCGCSSENQKNSIFKKGTNNIFLEEVLNELGFCSVTDDDLDGTVGGNGDKIMTNRDNVKDICGVNYYDSFIRKNTRNPCESNTIKTKGWICDGTTRSVGTLLSPWKNKACLAPRTQALCLGFLHTNDKNGNYYHPIENIDSNEKLLTELVYAANVEGQNLKKNYKGSTDTEMNKLCNDLKYSFADLGDVIRGRSIWENIYTINMETNLKAIFKRIYDKLPSEKKNIYNDITKNYYDLRETWWNTNREYIWKALSCGAGMDKYNRCGDSVPNIDYMPQFLRWMTEWSGHFCEEKNTYDITYIHIKNKNEDKNIKSMCTGCNYNGAGDCLTSYPESGHVSSNPTCSECKKTCEQYTQWIRNQKKEYEQQKNKYNEEIKNALKSQQRRTNHSMYLKNNMNITEFFTKIKKDYPKANQFLQEQLKETGCDQNVEAVNFEKEPNTFYEKHRYCRTCAEQKHLEDATGISFLPDGLPGRYPYNPILTGTTIVPPNTTGSQNIPRTTAPGTSDRELKEEKEKHECDGVFDGKWNEWDCNETDKNTQSVCRKKIDTDYNKEFFDLFHEWIEDFLKEHKQFITKVESCINNNAGNISNCPNEECRNHCHCYNKWAHNKQKEWNSQKEFFKTNNKESFELFSHGGNDYYLDLYLDNLHFLNDFGIHENTTPSSQIQQKINDAIYKSEDCVKKCPKPIKCEDKGFDNDWQCDHATSSLGYTNKSMCLRKGDDKYEKPNLNELDTVYKFYDVFNEWLNDIQRLLEENIEILKSSCTNKFISMKNNTKNNKNNCNICRDDCKCYDNLRKKINEQWEKQKQNFKIYKNFEENMMRNIDLDTYLEAQCEYNLTENGKSESEAQEKCSKKNTSSGSRNHTIFDEMLETKSKEKQSVCESCEKVNENKPVDEKTCKEISDIDKNKCKTKDYDDPKDPQKNEPKKSWDCRNKNSSNTSSTQIKKAVCVPPRGQSICVANMADTSGVIQEPLSKEDDLKTKLKEAIKTETKELHKYYKQKNKSGTTSGQVPPGFCNTAYRSFNDFKNLVTGNMLWKPPSISAIDTKIGQLIQNGSSGTASAEDRLKWWKKNESDFWNAVKCGIKAANSGLNGNECPRFISDDDQFEWWAKEWSDDFYDKRKILVGQMEAKCGSGNSGCSGSSNTPNGVCGIECGKYKDFLEKKRKEWKDNFKTYLDDKEEQQNTQSVDDTKTYSPHNYYLLYPCTYQSCDGTHIKDLLGNKEHGEYENKCTCKANSSKTKDAQSSENNHCNTSFEFHACNEKKYKLGSWSSTYMKNPKDRGKVFAPPRRNSICIGWLFSPIETNGGKSGNSKDKAKAELKSKVMDAARGEAHYLWKRYLGGSNSGGNSDGNSGNTEEYCSALKRSFADIGNMVKGTDMWMAGYSPLVEQNIYNVFAMKDTSATTPPIEEQIEKERKEWWDQNKDNVWETMSKCDKNNTCEKNTPTDDKKPQFLRWLEEWGEYICEQREKQIKQLEKLCKNGNDVENDKKCDKGNKECKQQCYKYNNWINVYKREWLGQKSKYKEIYGNKDKPGYKDYEPYIKSHANANTYIGESNNKCKSSGTSGGSNNINLDDVFQKRDDQYKKYEPFCTTCRVNEIADTVKKKQKRGRVNPCANPSGSQPTTSVEHIAKTLHEEAKKQLEDNDSENKLKGKPEQGEYRHNSGGKASTLTDICSITDKHSNDKRVHGSDYKGPCTGKGTGKDNSEHTRFVVGFQWLKDARNMNQNHMDVIMPPRRRHICTSNLENLDVERAEGLKQDNKVNHSFLGDVLLSTKEEAKKTIEMYKQKNGLNGQKEPIDSRHQTTICRAVRSSFADMGDIIRGRDLWSRNKEMIELEKHLVKIFAKIKGTLPGEIQSKYDNTDSKYLDLRKDWWEANRGKIWDAMKCHLGKMNDTSPDGKSSSHCGYKESVPLDDYIPQRLRWMTEWAEWFCKAQKLEYDKVRMECINCKNQGSGGGKSVTCNDCDICKTACGKYKGIIDAWKQQWTEIETKYQSLYQQAKSANNSSSNSGDPHQKYLDEFIQKLQTLNGSNNTFENAAAYVHDIGNFDDCQEQNVFCNSGGNNYAFKYPPHDHEAKCKCTTPAKPVAVLPPAAAAAKPTSDHNSPQAAKPAATKPATTKPVVEPTHGGGQGQQTQSQGTEPDRGASPTVTTITASTLDGKGILSVTTVPSTATVADPVVNPTTGSQGNPDPEADPSRPQGTSTSSSGEPPPQNPTLPVSSPTINPEPSSSYKPTPQFRNAVNTDQTFIDRNRNFVDSSRPSSSSSNASNKKKNKIPVEYMNCVEKAANELQKNAEKEIENVKNTLMGTKTEDVYKTEQNGWSNTSNCTITNPSSNTGQTYNCDGNGNPFDEIDKWSCDKDTKNVTNEHICLPPRRKHMCTKTLEDLKEDSVQNTDDLLKEVLITAANEGKHLKEQWKKTESTQKKADGTTNRPSIKRYELCDAMKYSFADLGDIIRGMDNYKGMNGTNGLEKQLNGVFEKIRTQWVNENGGKHKDKYNDVTSFRYAWWDANRKYIWEAMTCTAPANAYFTKTYTDETGIQSITLSQYKMCGHANYPPDEDYIPQPFRWLTEWSEHFCKELNKKMDEMKKAFDECKNKDEKCTDDTNENNKCKNCKEKCDDYKKFVDKWNSHFENQNQILKQLNIEALTSGSNTNKMNFKNFLQMVRETKGCSVDDAHKYLDQTSNCTKFKFTQYGSTHRANTPYAFETYPKEYKNVCNGNDHSSINTDGSSGGWFKFGWKSFRLPKFRGIRVGWLQPIIPRLPEPTIIPLQVANTVLSHQEDIKKVAENINEAVGVVAGGINTAVVKTKDVVKNILIPKNPEQKDTSIDSTTTTKPNQPKQKKIDPYIHSRPEIYVPATSLGLFVLGFILYKWKKLLPRSKRHVDDMIRILEMPQNDYGIPDEAFTNRYVPYGRYKGKTYIYVENDTDDDNYVVTTDTSDITSSSESEYEDLDINDIYPYKSPKYKTLIEVVLKPTKSDITYSADTPNSGTIPPIPSDIPTNKLTDDEWNELKQDFILNMLQNDNMDISRENISGNIYMDNPPHTVDNRFGEKPFITQIQDRYLHGDNQVSYNIDWNIPKQKEVTSNIVDIPTYVSQNLYSGIDLINDSLNGNEHIDIYDELLKRKENELFGTKYMKHTTTNSVSKKTNRDPIMNQLDLFHKWLDRHRDMCNKWNKNEMLTNLINEWKSNEKKYISHIMSDQLLNPMDTTKLYTNVSMKINVNGNNSIPDNVNQYIEDVSSINSLYNIEKNVDERYVNDIDDSFF
ncbi:erythrocyte membrane protein 1, PfEMP1, putative [Plasmodium sp. gorilla clade G2]|uniref:erythrocyte membrane protein 1, PfEMP1, putative n=1 Tax=Plasmodium sp. gorilla clade G2 TaxID=880535 RepID=UPI000D20603C|nr:erythrocyte membrane protein 1, PfEMP1, putative [Plasmodium sp. gorilla clade G2]SOV13001.1 erythrocyte membrane protein 1, PfEMP1, putative [Plasmodium sp. gorilla clade G2]